MHVAIPHKMSQSAAAARVKKALDENRAQIAQYANITEEKWEGNSLAFVVELQGKEITGTLQVTDTEYVLDAKLPLLWRMFEGRIESQIEEQVKKMS